MSKNKSDARPHYELLYLISNQFSEDELGPVKDKVEAVIVANGGVISARQSLGKKRLAYKIKQFRHGYYELAEFDAPAAGLPKINNELRLSSDILRHQILKCQPKTAEQLAKEAKIISDLAKDEKEAETPVVKNHGDRQANGGKAALTKHQAPIAETAKKEADADKVELFDLDDKLNQILDTDNLL